jgi:hypothetical protein
MSGPRVPRREFLLRALAACGAGFLAPLGATLACRRTTGAGAGARAAASYLGPEGVAAVRAIGEAYLRSLGLERDTGAIVRAAAGSLDVVGKASGDEAAVAALVEAVRLDFVEGREVQLEGWIFSRTELELCLLTLAASA